MCNYKLRVALLALALTSAGCATYVNIPPQPGDWAWHSPNNPTVRVVSIAAVNAVLADRPIPGKFTLVLPPGTMPTTYQQVIDKLDDQATIAVEDTYPIVEVLQLRVRADLAQVDVLRPADPTEARGPGQMVTAYLRWDAFLGWLPERVHIWRVPISITVPSQGYADPPPIVQPVLTPNDNDTPDTPPSDAPAPQTSPPKTSAPPEPQVKLPQVDVPQVMPPDSDKPK